ncbi:MAG: hypothetical protein AB7N91_05545 [Candidatus Tectimicrobiota bacterium]
MTTHAPLEHLVLHLLALASAAPALSPETLARLAALAPTVEPSVTSLLTTTVRLQTALSQEPVFQRALRALEGLRPPERHGLSLDEVCTTLHNPEATPASGIEVLAQTTAQILQEPGQTPQSLLQRLAALIHASWPLPRTQP